MDGIQVLLRCTGQKRQKPASGWAMNQTNILIGGLGNDSLISGCGGNVMTFAQTGACSITFGIDVANDDFWEMTS